MNPTEGQQLPPILSIADLEACYIRYAQDAPSLCLDLADWLPSFRRQKVRPLVPGELCFIMGDTGAGKTACLMNIALAQQAENCLLFEMELPGTLVFERYISIAYKIGVSEIEESARERRGFSVAMTNHLYTVEATRLPMETMLAVIQKAKADGINPRFVFVDYIGLMGGPGKSRHEKVAQAAEDLKVLARDTDTVIIAATQMHRQEDGDYEPNLHSAKNAGEIENSCGLLLGIWRDSQDKTLLWVRILKNTKGESGGTIACNFDGPTMRITERVMDTGER